MNIYIDESVHEAFGFMILAYVICNHDPQHDIDKILSEYSISEHHSCVRMDNSTPLRKLRVRLISYLNSNCLWGAYIMPSEYRHHAYEDVSFLLSSLTKTFQSEKLNFFLDEGIINATEALRLCSDEVKVITCSSHEICGVQLADLVASFSGVRFREAITGKAKILTYGYDCGYEPPIEAPLGFELFTTLRQSMLRENEPLGEGMPEFATFKTVNKGLVLSENLSIEFSKLALKTFGDVYLGCVH
ncbi:DUF3800 domain-containing protein [Edwardsiella tarda]|uniref:DUF3800 domain-containing protein n=1 Tax=Edwardsiella tarda TaxID=636 RepID=UPI0011B255C2|nr:DUF3800 domain-containing protein [Edwardsiella tarda]UCQ29180.1 DUF3800 domain-containing protein [Edwardsiella tarda]